LIIYWEGRTKLKKSRLASIQFTDDSDVGGFKIKKGAEKCNDHIP